MTSSVFAMAMTALMASIAGMIPSAFALTPIRMQNHLGQADHDLVFMHVPYNFGHTVEFSRMLPQNLMDAVFSGHREGSHGGSLDELDAIAGSPMASFAHQLKPDGEAWGHFNQDLSAVSEVTGCSLYYTPQKYWPADIAEKYFGNKTVFGLLRDPYERLIAFFRGGFSNYGGSYPEFFETCDVNGALKQMMKMVLDDPDHPFMNKCTFIPQAEYFEGPYGITLPIDNRLFPTSMNEAFEAHGYSERIKTQDIGHVSGCNNVWAGDLDAETKQMVREVYSRDFELLCKHFGYCNPEENVCLQQVEHMCPEKAFQWDSNKMAFVARST